MNSYFGNFSGLIIRPAKSVADLTDYNKQQTKQKDFSSLPKVSSFGLGTLGIVAKFCF